MKQENEWYESDETTKKECDRLLFSATVTPSSHRGGSRVVCAVLWISKERIGVFEIIRVECCICCIERR